MTELRRLLDGNSDELALALLRSAGDDSPSTDSLKAAAVVLGIGTSLGGSALLASGLRSAAGPSIGAASGAASQAASAVTPAVAALTLGAVAKQVAVGLACGLFAMGGLQLAIEHPFAAKAPVPQNVAISSARMAPELRARAQLGAALPDPAAPSVAAESAQPSAPQSANEGAAVRAVRRRVAVAQPAEAAAPPATTPEPAVELKPAPEIVKPQAVALNKSLAAEVALLDRARSALRAQNAPGALHALEQYKKERQTAILDPEATVLQIQVLEQLGDRAAAARLARQFISSHPESRHVDSLRVFAAQAP